MKKDKTEEVSGAGRKRPLFKKWWFWVVVVLIVGAVGSAASGGAGTDSKSPNTVADSWDASSVLPGMTVEAAWDEIEENGFELAAIKSVTGAELNSDESERHSSSSQSWKVLEAEQDDAQKTVTIVITSPEDYDEKTGASDGADAANSAEEVPAAYSSALSRAQSYSDMMHMSKQGIYDQLVSEYGDQFEADAAQYAVDNVEADWNANALAKAEDYSETMHKSKQGIYDQLTSEYGEKFTAEEAQYAVDNVQADWNANALAMARNYQETMNMSPEAIRDQLVSEYGEGFTPEEADYAIANL